MTKKWAVYPRDERSAEMAKALKIHPIITDILIRRGLTSEADIFSFLSPSLDLLEDPFVFQDMAKTVSRIRRAINDRETILVYGDYDVDGVTGSAILYSALKKCGAAVEFHIPHRVKEGYGLNRASLEHWVKKVRSEAGSAKKDRTPLLVITVDNGITGTEAVKYLKQNRADVILVDHHVPKGEIPPADAIISAAVNDKKGDPNLAACGLAFKLVWALTDFEKAKEFMDLVAVGTVADLAPVLGDNRILLKHGLGLVAKTKNLGLRALMESAGIKAPWISYRDLAFGLGPRINASGRMGSPLNAFKLLTTDNAIEARNLAAILEEGNRDRQRVEQDATREATRLVENRLKPEHRNVLVVESAGWHVGVLGIVAARLVEKFKRPSVVIALSGSGEFCKGSGRSLPSFSLFESVLKCEDLLETFGGHAQACGLTIREDRISAFRDRLNLVGSEATGAPEDPGLEAELLPSELDLRFVKDLEKLAPFGPGNPGPRFLSRNMRVRGEVKKRGKDTLQCWMTDESGSVTCEVVGFRCYEKWRSNEKKQSRFDIVYRPALKNFNGIETIQLELEAWA